MLFRIEFTLYDCSVFNEAVGSSGYITPNGRIVSKQLIWKVFKTSAYRQATLPETLVLNQ
jgi:hypothetical protein